MTRLADFSYYLPKNLIAQKPVTPRDSSRLLVLNRKTGTIEHQRFYQIDKYLRAGDVLVVNNSKVIPARLIGKKETGGKIEILLLREVKPGIWEALLNRKVFLNDKISIGTNFQAKVVALPTASRKWLVRFNCRDRHFGRLLSRYGRMPVPPYVKTLKSENTQAREQKFKDQYQTVYADERKKGSVAAPTAGFHFTSRLLNKLKRKGVQLEYVTLHVGLGTFAPVRCSRIENHQMHSEYAEIDQKTLTRLRRAKEEGRRIISVGTTSTRVLESVFSDVACQCFVAGNWVNLFIYPGYQFHVVDAMITNFHLPESTLLMLVSAFASLDLIKIAYREAIKEKYRFYSFGDAMLII